MGLSKQEQAVAVMLTPMKMVMTLHRGRRHHSMMLKKWMVTLHSEEADGNSGALARPAGVKILTSKVCMLVLPRILYGMLGEENMDACISK
jgi:hypothetical protein